MAMESPDVQDVAEQLQAIPGMASCALLQGDPRREAPGLSMMR